MASFLDGGDRRGPGTPGAASCALCPGASTPRWWRAASAAVGDRLTAVFVDNGLLRKGEVQQVQHGLRDGLGCRWSWSMRGGVPRRSAGVEDPEEKRRIIGRVFIEVFEAEAAKLEDVALPGPGHPLPGRHRVGLGQGALGGHQDAPQRRRASRAAAASSSSSRSAAVQGRGAPAGPRARLPEEFIGRHPVPGPGPGRADPGRGDDGAGRRAAGGRRHLHARSCARAASTTR